MELLPSLLAIWRRRLPLTAGALVAAAVLVALGGTKLVTTPSAVAWTSVVVDTPSSQLVTATPPGASTLAWRASLLMHLMASDTSTKELAQSLGVASDQVTVSDLALATPLVPTAMAQAAAAAASRDAAPYTLTVFAPSGSLPLIAVEAAAPDRGGAERLAQAGVSLLESQASSPGPFRSLIPTAGKTFERQPFVIGQVAPVRVKALSATAVPAKAIGASLVIFLAWCAGVLLLPRLARAIRARWTAVPV